MASWTTLSSGTRYKQIDWGRMALPPCQAHLIKGGEPCKNPGEFDSPVAGYTAWADLCWDHATALAPSTSIAGFHRVPFLTRSREEAELERKRA